VPGISVTINGFDISGVAVGDGNGAAIRYEGGNLSLSNDYFHNNQEGLLGNGDDPNGTISIDHSEIAFNGDGSGFTHGLYIGAIAQFSLTNSYVHDTAVGHEVKSRAQDNTITNDRILDNARPASYSIDLPNGGNATIQNDVLQQAATVENPYIIAYAEEGQSNPGTNVSIADNTIVNDLHNGNEAAVFNAGSQALPFTNNSVFGLTASQLSFDGSLAEGGTVFLSSRPSLDTSSLSFINPPGDTGGGTGGGTGGDTGGGTGGNPPPPPPPPPALSLNDWYFQITTEFMNYAGAHPEVLADQGALGALITELSSPVVLTAPVPGDLWS
jgi:hypothetical protein